MIISFFIFSLIFSEIKFNNPIDLCLEDWGTIENIDTYKPLHCKDYDPDKLEQSGYIEEGNGLRLCVGWVYVDFPSYYIGCNKNKLKKKITLRRIPYYKDKRFSIYDRYEILPKGLMIQHWLRVGLGDSGGVLFLKDGYKEEDIKSDKLRDYKYVYLTDKIDLSKANYISIKNLYESKRLRSKCRKVYMDYEEAKGRDDAEKRKKPSDIFHITFIGDHGYFEEIDPDDCDMMAISEDGGEKNYKWVCSTQEDKIGSSPKEELINIWKGNFNKIKDKIIGQMIKEPYSLCFCITGEYIFEVKSVRWSE